MLDKELKYQIDPHNPGKILWLGNGINRTFSGDSWEKIILDSLKRNDVNYSYGDIKKLPSIMQIVVATKNNVDSYMKQLANDLKKGVNSEEFNEFIKNNILETEFKTILTTNYTYELEFALNPNYSISPNNSSRRKIVEGNARQNKFMIFRYNHLSDKQKNNKNSIIKQAEKYKNIWHIHGEICTPSTMIMGHYYYGYMISIIKDYISKNTGYWNLCIKKGEKINVKSWIDYFLFCDVYVDGFGMDLSELDFWWLACKKQLEFPETKIYVYEPNIQKNSGVEIMAKTYGIELFDVGRKVSDYKAYHEDVFKRMRT